MFQKIEKFIALVVACPKIAKGKIWPLRTLGVKSSGLQNMVKLVLQEMYENDGGLQIGGTLHLGLGLRKTQKLCYPSGGQLKIGL